MWCAQETLSTNKDKDENMIDSNERNISMEAALMESRNRESVYMGVLALLVERGHVSEGDVEKSLRDSRDAVLTSRQYRSKISAFARRLGISEDGRSRGFANFAVDSNRAIRNVLEVIKR